MFEIVTRTRTILLLVSFGAPALRERAQEGKAFHWIEKGGYILLGFGLGGLHYRLERASEPNGSRANMISQRKEGGIVICVF
jgi:hypothetical protein